MLLNSNKFIRLNNECRFLPCAALLLQTAFCMSDTELSGSMAAAMTYSHTLSHTLTVTDMQALSLAVISYRDDVGTREKCRVGRAS